MYEDETNKGKDSQPEQAGPNESLELDLSGLDLSGLDLSGLEFNPKHIKANPIKEKIDWSAFKPDPQNMEYVFDPKSGYQEEPGLLPAHNFTLKDENLPKDDRGGFHLMNDYIDILKEWGWTTDSVYIRTPYDAVQGYRIAIYRPAAKSENGDYGQEGKSKELVYQAYEGDGYVQAWSRAILKSGVRPQLDAEIKRRKDNSGNNGSNTD